MLEPRSALIDHRSFPGFHPRDRASRLATNLGGSLLLFVLSRLRRMSTSSCRSILDESRTLIAWTTFSQDSACACARRRRLTKRSRMPEVIIRLCIILVSPFDFVQHEAPLLVKGTLSAGDVPATSVSLPRLSILWQTPLKPTANHLGTGLHSTYCVECRPLCLHFRRNL